MRIRSWQDALDRLYGLANWETRPPGTELSFELNRIRRILAALGDPHRMWPAVHVAGTNGKGSTCAMLAAAIGAAGYRVGFFSSPHLHSVRERIQVDGQMIGEGEAMAWLERNEAIFEAEPTMTTFEALTALAFDHFASRGVEVAVVEVGLGGRLDTTNVVLPAACAITAIGLDHVAVLGGSLRSIARDKAGILKPGVPAVIAPQEPEALEEIRSEAERVGCPLIELADRWRWSTGRASDAGQAFTLSPFDRPAEAFEIEIGLLGAHQRVNAATAVALLEQLAERGFERIDRAAIVRGLALARWPARFERMAWPAHRLAADDSVSGVDDGGSRPLVIIDGAHNEAAARVLLEALEERYPGRPRAWILGFSRDKDIGAILDTLLAEAEPVWAVHSAHPRARSAEEVAALVTERGRPAQACASPADALRLAMDSVPADSLVVATGSIFAAADLRKAWLGMAGLPLPPSDPELPEPGGG